MFVDFYSSYGKFGTVRYSELCTGDATGQCVRNCSTDSACPLFGEITPAAVTFVDTPLILPTSSNGRKVISYADLCEVNLPYTVPYVNRQTLPVTILKGLCHQFRTG